MPTLLLLRHAKSSWENDDLDDFDRPLNPRGRRAAPAMGKVLLERELVPDRVLCSPAARTRETWALVEDALETEVPAEYPDALYLADTSEMVEEIRSGGREARRLLVVGHNPGMERLALALAGDGPLELRARMAVKYPTAALAVLGFEGGWGAVAPGRGRLVHFIRPKDLPDADEKGL